MVYPPRPSGPTSSGPRGKRQTWRDLAGDVQAAITDHAKEQGTPRHQVEADVKKAARHPDLVAGG
ncbi:hypothetical protein [Streptomyces sp. DH10]|uniref:hypothetical protein n=1 Tax=Streptomyces sp. DH10 TaxID=3040121 RepID=UPI00301480C2